MIKWRIFQKQQNGMSLLSEHDTKRECTEQVKARAVGAIVRVPNTRDYVISVKA